MKSKTHVRIKPELYAAVAEYAEETGGKISGYVSVAVAEWLKDKQRKH